MEGGSDKAATATKKDSLTVNGGTSKSKQATVAPCAILLSCNCPQLHYTCFQSVNFAKCCGQ